jgi:osmotically-inducible protein OsmY
MVFQNSLRAPESQGHEEDIRLSTPLHKIVAALGLLALLSGCVAAAASGAAAGVAGSADRSIGDQVRDATIKGAISAVWKKTNSEMSSGIDCGVYEGRVLITGRLPNPAWIEDAVRIAWRVKGVQQVYNEITVGPIPGTGDDLNDGFISTRLRNELIWDADVRSVNFIVTTADHVVYIIGSARSPEELERVTGYARNIPNVRRVVSYVQVRGGPAPAASPKPASAPAAPPASPNRTAPIQVQPLQ